MDLKFRNKPKGKYKSGLEKSAAKLLDESGLEWQYEPGVVPLVPASKGEGVSYEVVGKKNKQYKQTKSIHKITFKPDFVGDNGVIETKGMKTEAFVIRGKLFKKYLTANNLKYNLFMPTNIKQIKESIDIIKQLRSHETSKENKS